MLTGKVAAVVLAAGEGKRLKSKLPKVLHRVAGKPLLAHAVGAVQGVGPAEIVVVASPRVDEIRAELENFGLTPGYVVQDPPRGTGDAVRVGLSGLDGEASTVLVTNGDMPLLTTETFAAIVERHAASGAAATMLISDAPADSDFGRVIRDADGSVERIVEYRDATEQERSITEVNINTFVFDAALLTQALEKLSPENSQGEYYLTDVVELLRADGHDVEPHKVGWEETLGVNDRVQLGEVTARMFSRTAQRWMREGVTIVDPATTYIDDTVTIEQDVTILPGTMLEGSTTIASGAEVGPHSRVIDSAIGAGATVTYAVVRSSEVGPEASVGPFASLRPGTKLSAGAKLGTFVETKNAVLGEGSKAPHLSYLGDAEIGNNVNVGAGTITCNWDGRNKHKTVIEDDAYISSDTMLVAPVRIGKRAATGAGSVVRDDVPDDALAVGVPARIIEGKGDRKSKKGD